MIVIKQACAFFLSKVEQHSYIKHNLLDSIKSMGIHSAIDENQKISNLDFHLSPNHKRPYYSLVEPIFRSHLSKLVDALKYKDADIDELAINNCWFQQYETGDYHKWHIHNGSIYSNVYYVELPNGASKTSFKLIDEIYTVDVEEGDILSFPAALMHCSSINLSESRKTVIAFDTTSVKL